MIEHERYNGEFRFLGGYFVVSFSISDNFSFSRPTFHAIRLLQPDRSVLTRVTKLALTTFFVPGHAIDYVHFVRNGEGCDPTPKESTQALQNLLHLCL